MGSTLNNQTWQCKIRHSTCLPFKHSLFRSGIFQLATSDYQRVSNFGNLLPWAGLTCEILALEMPPTTALAKFFMAGAYSTTAWKIAACYSPQSRGVFFKNLLAIEIRPVIDFSGGMGSISVLTLCVLFRCSTLLQCAPRSAEVFHCVFFHRLKTTGPALPFGRAANEFSKLEIPCEDPLSYPLGMTFTGLAMVKPWP